MDEAESLCTLTRRIKEKRPCGTYTVNCLWGTGARIEKALDFCAGELRR